MAELLHAVEPTGRKAIEARTEALEGSHDIRKLYACESGSRGRGVTYKGQRLLLRFVDVRRITCPSQVLSKSLKDESR
jgi:hypothetical protein